LIIYYKFVSLNNQEYKIERKSYILWIAQFIIISLIFLTSNSCCCQPPDINQLAVEYLQKWKLFYPSEALAAGDKGSALRFEDFSDNNIQKWIKFNEEILLKISENKYKYKLLLDEKIDMKLLERKINQEIYKWKNDKAHLNSPSLYENLISQAFTHIIARPLKDRSAMREAVTTRLHGVVRLCQSAVVQLENGAPERSTGAAHSLKNTAGFYRSGLPDILGAYFNDPSTNNKFQEDIERTAQSIRELSSHITLKIIPGSSISDQLGKEKYNKILRLYTGLKIHSLKLRKISSDEIKLVREMIKKLSVEFFKSKHPGKYAGGIIPEKCIQYAFTEMESHRVNNSADFLEQFKTLIDEAENFIYKKKITSIKDSRSLHTALSPSHFAGAAIGGVYPAGPFDPDADTLFYLPTIPDDSPGKVKDGFYRSFNDHFNKMIITHEIFPGHYFQLKESSRNPHIVRTVFGDDLFIEGWATLCEQLTLDRGWDKNNILTRLAHLRKRLENAVRAFSSVQVHCNGWSKERVLTFAVEKGLLAPQFAENLWHRVINSPFQLTSYFLGFRKFDMILKKREKNPKFSIQKFCDRILNSGSMSLDLIEQATGS